MSGVRSSKDLLTTLWNIFFGFFFVLWFFSLLFVAYSAIGNILGESCPSESVWFGPYCYARSLAGAQFLSFLADVAGILSFLIIFPLLRKQRQEQIDNNNYLLDRFNNLQERVLHRLDDSTSPKEAMEKFAGWIKDDQKNAIVFVSANSAVPGFWLMYDLPGMVTGGVPEGTVTFKDTLFIGPAPDTKEFEEAVNALVSSLKRDPGDSDSSGGDQLEKARQAFGKFFGELTRDEFMVNWVRSEDKAFTLICARYEGIIARIRGAGGVVHLCGSNDLQKIHANFVVRSHVIESRRTPSVIYFGTGSVAERRSIFFAENATLGRMFARQAVAIREDCKPLLREIIDV